MSSHQRKLKKIHAHGPFDHKHALSKSSNQQRTNLITGKKTSFGSSSRIWWTNTRRSMIKDRIAEAAKLTLRHLRNGMKCAGEFYTVGFIYFKGLVFLLLMVLSHSFTGVVHWKRSLGERQPNKSSWKRDGCMTTTQMHPQILTLTVRCDGNCWEKGERRREGEAWARPWETWASLWETWASLWEAWRGTDGWTDVRTDIWTNMQIPPCSAGLRLL